MPEECEVVQITLPRGEEERKAAVKLLSESLRPHKKPTGWTFVGGVLGFSFIILVGSTTVGAAAAIAVLTYRWTIGLFGG